MELNIPSKIECISPYSIENHTGYTVKISTQYNKKELKTLKKLNISPNEITIKNK